MISATLTLRRDHSNGTIVLLTKVRRYQLGIPVWRGLGGLTEIVVEGTRYAREKDQTAV